MCSGTWAWKTHEDKVIVTDELWDPKTSKNATNYKIVFSFTLVLIFAIQTLNHDNLVFNTSTRFPTENHPKAEFHIKDLILISITENGVNRVKQRLKNKIIPAKNGN